MYYSAIPLSIANLEFSSYSHNPPRSPALGGLDLHGAWRPALGEGCTNGAPLAQHGGLRSGVSATGLCVLIRSAPAFYAHAFHDRGGRSMRSCRVCSMCVRAHKNTPAPDA